MKILAAMSGGVDSAVAAARAVDAGHDVVGVHLALSRAGGTLRTGSRGCCTIEDAMDARRAADRLGIPFYVWDFSERFRDDVIEDFVSEYRAGRTPNPCMRCNEKIKFAALLERALELGFDAVCTGHYATLVDTPAGLELHRASDAAKDQSYVLGVLTAQQLAHTYFPLGSTPSKAIVRAEAEARGLAVAQKPDSHDICFIPDGDTRGWLAERVGTATGEVVDRTGAVVGSHEGAHAFTVGQRRGLSLGVPAPDGKPRFVLEVRPVSNTVVVGPKEALATAEIAGERHSWAGRPQPEGAFACHVQIRAHADPVPARAVLDGGVLTVVPESPFEGVAPGQTAVLYDGTRVIGQFTIDRTVSAVPVDA
ncbi:tRNA 2-thiouridine(34) synthase MnmA [Microbacterium sp. SSM24]|uniref:tRNA 2-thiouridine(34) synthase MnmA n=1 Tax=Microbacterium sp. SSM24 TaxID=2991714 RepID=UPI0022265CAD|nr:tRNA 2-thiouridine(34) synthase MnmA [Microbacterium sp. SSM24]MCW3494314.1 tRNA 2-thiouridine(34) synthase MnmA [Microbacterium sp. SSM24]